MSSKTSLWPRVATFRNLVLAATAAGLLAASGCGDDEAKQPTANSDAYQATLERLQAENQARDEQYEIDQRKERAIWKRVKAQLEYADFNLIVTKSTITPALESKAIEYYCSGLVASVEGNRIYCGFEDSE